MRPVREPPGADPHAGWCGEGRLDAGPYPIGLLTVAMDVVLNIFDLTQLLLAIIDLLAQER